MKKYKKTIIATFIVGGIFLIHIVDYVVVKSQRFFSRQASSSLAKKSESMTKHVSEEFGYELKHPASWVVGGDQGILEINPQREGGGGTYFSISRRDEFASIDEIKNKLAPSIRTEEFEHGGASGFKFKDSDFREVIWLMSTNAIYVIRVYPSSQEATNILQSLQFNN